MDEQSNGDKDDNGVVKVLIGSWNISKLHQSILLEIPAWLEEIISRCNAEKVGSLSDGNQTAPSNPDIIVLGFQECIGFFPLKSFQ